jgi:hypothetical protein
LLGTVRLLYLPYTSQKPPRGSTPCYGEQLDYAALPEQARVSSMTEGRFLIETYAVKLLHFEIFWYSGIK